MELEKSELSEKLMNVDQVLSSVCEQLHDSQAKVCVLFVSVAATHCTSTTSTSTWSPSTHCYDLLSPVTTSPSYTKTDDSTRDKTITTENSGRTARRGN